MPVRTDTGRVVVPPVVSMRFRPSGDAPRDLLSQQCFAANRDGLRPLLFNVLFPPWRQCVCGCDGTVALKAQEGGLMGDSNEPEAFMVNDNKCVDECMWNTHEKNGKNDCGIPPAGKRSTPA